MIHFEDNCDLEEIEYILFTIDRIEKKKKKKK